MDATQGTHSKANSYLCAYTHKTLRTKTSAETKLVNNATRSICNLLWRTCSTKVPRYCRYMSRELRRTNV